MEQFDGTNVINTKVCSKEVDEKDGGACDSAAAKNMDSELNFYLIMGLAVLLLVCMVSVWVSLFRLRRRYRMLLQGSDGQDLGQLLNEFMRKISVLESKILALGHQQKCFEKVSDKAMAGLGVVRFSAFENVGGDQSFAIALLDRSGNGVVLTSLFGTNESRFYAKPIKHQASEYNLSKEETAAIAKAMQSIKDM